MLDKCEWCILAEKNRPQSDKLGYALCRCEDGVMALVALDHGPDLRAGLKDRMDTMARAYRTRGDRLVTSPAWALHYWIRFER